MGLEQNISSFVPYQIGQVFVMVFQGWGLLIARAVLTVQDVGDRQWQYALGGFFQALSKTSFISCCATSPEAVTPNSQSRVTPSVRPIPSVFAGWF